MKINTIYSVMHMSVLKETGIYVRDRWWNSYVFDLKQQSLEKFLK